MESTKPALISRDVLGVAVDSNYSPSVGSPSQLIR